MQWYNTDLFTYCYAFTALIPVSELSTAKLNGKYFVQLEINQVLITTCA